MLHIGCHLSSTKGYLAMGQEALRIGADTFAFFTRNPRGGNAKPMNEEDAKALMELMKVHRFPVILAHAPYTLNPCSATEKTREFARLTGKAVPEIQADGPNLAEAFAREHGVTVLLETMAGKGSEVGGTFEELREILDRVELKEKMGVCLDTCHVHDGGYDIVRDLDGVLKEFDRVIGLEWLKAVHINDSKNPFASHKDRHEKIGFGTLGEEMFRAVVTHPDLRELPFILETPQEDNDGYAGEIRMLRGFAK